MFVFFPPKKYFIWVTGEPKHQSQLRLCPTNWPRAPDHLFGSLLQRLWRKHPKDSCHSIQPRWRRLSAWNCLSAARSIISNYTSSQPWMVEGETPHHLAASGRAEQDAATQEIVCPRLSLSPLHTFFLGWNTTVVGYGWLCCNNCESCLNKRVSSLLPWPSLLGGEGARTASPSARPTSLLQVLCSLM